MINALDAAILWDILGRWIDLKSLVRLDTAHCHRKERQALACLLSSKEYVFRDIVTFYKPERFEWLSIKAIKASNILIGPYTDPERLSDYLSISGPTVSTVKIQFVQKIEVTYSVAIYCKNLQTLVCEGIVVGTAFKEILRGNPSISEIKLDGVNGQCTDMFEKAPLRKLATLSISNSMCNNTHFSLSRVPSKNTLLKLRLGISMVPAVVLQLAHSSPALRTLSLKDAQLRNETFIKVCSILPNLLHLDVSTNRFLSSTVALQMFEALKKLRSINIQACTAIGDVSIRNLAAHCGNTLEVVYMPVQNVNDPSTVKALRKFSEQCPRLHFLSISCNRSMLCPGGGTFALLHGLPALRTLVVDSESVVSVSSRGFLKLIKPQLQIEVISAEKHTYDALTMPIG